MRAYFSLLLKTCDTHTHFPAVLLKEEIPFVCDFSIENCGDSSLYFGVFTYFIVLFLFFGIDY